jgi:hypothetical protein
MFLFFFLFFIFLSFLHHTLTTSNPTKSNLTVHGVFNASIERSQCRETILCDDGGEFWFEPGPGGGPVEDAQVMEPGSRVAFEVAGIVVANGAVSVQGSLVPAGTGLVVGPGSTVAVAEPLSI